MQILSTVLRDILRSVPDAPPEMGGILGGKNGIVMDFEIDNQEQLEKEYAYYRPNVTALNRRIRIWENKNLHFYGMFHSHFPDGYELSIGDRNYIERIMLSMPAQIQCLYFPIIVAGEMVGYQALRYEDHICIVNDDIKIIYGRLK